ncbi:conserved hypothetical protein [Streptomyces himastatinicus ATCC 53653]|uniref:Uncharacterized protein n=1 Tax=Streptomyces himastatinicus ATCC 53653 TaxID=457427 RepID=D9WG41_9ACTN|nr:hypothetical protein [Streptomyces himastatinicus]EFL23257.1 conserved hypothetical protein [Streptomyces himastatinicus ATCC 53653]
MGTFTYSDLIALNLGKLGTAVDDWKTMVSSLDTLRSDVYDGLVQKSDAARWKGANATVTKDFVRSTAKEFLDLYAEAKSIHGVLLDAHTELVGIQKRVKSLTEEARRGDPARNPPDPGLLVTDGKHGTVLVQEAMCTKEGPTQRTKDRIRWYAETLTGLVAHAAEVDTTVSRALKKSHGGDPYNAGHATYTSLDEEQLPRATRLASLGEDANDKQRAELRRLWQSLSPEARSELWKQQKDGLLAAGLLSPSVKQIAPDGGSGQYGAESPGAAERWTRVKMKLITEGADWTDLPDASRNMEHYLSNSGDPMNLPVDKMMSDDEGFRHHIEDGIRQHQETWRTQALEEFKKNGGQPVAIPVETKNVDYSFDQATNQNWYYAVGSTRSNITGVVTVVTDAHGNPQVGLDYQANAWDRYNWDEGKGVNIGPMDIPDGQMARLHKTGLAQEFDMSGSSSVKHYDLGGDTPNEGPLPGPDKPGREGGRTDPTREQQNANR